MSFLYSVLWLFHSCVRYCTILQCLQVCVCILCNFTSEDMNVCYKAVAKIISPSTRHARGGRLLVTCCQATKKHNLSLSLQLLQKHAGWGEEEENLGPQSLQATAVSPIILHLSFTVEPFNSYPYSTCHLTDIQYMYHIPQGGMQSRHSQIIYFCRLSKAVLVILEY